MQFESALRTLATSRRSLQDGAALCATRDGPRSRQIHWSRTKCVIPFRRTALSFSRGLPRLLVPRFTIAILITRLTVFRHKVLPRACAEYCPPRTAHAASAPPAEHFRPRINTDSTDLTNDLSVIRENQCESVANALPATMNHDPRNSCRRPAAMQLLSDGR